MDFLKEVDKLQPANSVSEKSMAAKLSRIGEKAVCSSVRAVNIRAVR